MTVQARIYRTDPAERRSGDRIALRVGATVRSGGEAADALVHDLSPQGCRIEGPTDLQPGMRLSIGISGAGVIPAMVQRVAQEGYGCSFDHAIPQAKVDAALSAETVVYLEAHGRPAESTMPAEDRWSRRVRVAAIGSAAIASWFAVAAIVIR